MRTTTPRVGDRVLIERNEKLYPSKGTWPQFRGRTGTVVEVNRDRKFTHLTEWGVTFGAVRKTPTEYGSISTGDSVWFRGLELSLIPDAASEGPAEVGVAARR